MFLCTVGTSSSTAGVEILCNTDELRHNARMVAMAHSYTRGGDSSDACLAAILCVYGTCGPELWEDYRDAKQNSILLREHEKHESNSSLAVT